VGEDDRDQLLPHGPASRRHGEPAASWLIIWMVLAPDWLLLLCCASPGVPGEALLTIRKS